MEATSVRPEQGKLIRFDASHPFMYFIRDQKSGAILFAGRLMDPSVSK